MRLWILILGGLIVVLSAFVLGRVTSSNSRVVKEQNNITSVQSPKKIVTLNREFEFGPATTKFKFILDSAELRDEIIIKGQKAHAIDGKDFLVLNIKIKNDKDKPIELITSDFIRLSVNGNDSNTVAPDIHNDPVVVQPISTKETRV